MDFELNEEQRLIQETARRVAREVVAPRAAEVDERAEYPYDIFEAFKDLGLLGLSMPESEGGSGAGIFGLGVAVEEVAKYDCSAGLILVLPALATRPISLGGTEAQIQRWVRPVATGELRASFALTEPSAGSDAASLRATAFRDGDSYVLNGEKSYSSGGSVADFVTVFAKTDSSAGSHGISGFIVPRDTPGFSLIRTDRKLGVNGVPTAHFLLQDARVPKENLIGEVEGRGFNHALLALNCIRPLVGFRGLGLAEGCLSYALEFARKREAFGAPITNLQAIQFMLADMALAIESSRFLVYRAAKMVDDGHFQRKDAAYLSMAKTVASEAAVKVASDAMQILGAQGYMKDHPIERQWRDARQLMIVEGTSQVQRGVIARALLERDIVYG